MVGRALLKIGYRTLVARNTEIMMNAFTTSADSGNKLPLCVDLDGTLIRTDLLFEAFLILLRVDLFAALCVPFWLIRDGKAATKLRIATRVQIRAELLPYCEPVLDYLRAAHQSGRELVLATASAESHANAVAAHLGLFDQVLATRTPQTNLSSTRKARLLAERFPGGFEYVGNSRDDLPVWQQAAVVSVANASQAVRKAALAIGRTGFLADRPDQAYRPLLKAMRPHQWLKNTLVFIPALAGHRLMDAVALSQLALAFIAFCLCASSVYLLNDLLDIEADRTHPRKKLRPFAAGTLSAPAGVVCGTLLLLGAVGITQYLPWQFGAVLALYYVLTLGYSLRLKAQVVVDVMMLSTLYTIRVLAGAAATGIVPSFWLLAVSLFLFLSLALLKRYGEMQMLVHSGKRGAVGRGYTVDDSGVLLALGAASAYSAVLVLALYINSSDVSLLYKQPQLLWGAIPVFVYWLSRIWLKAHRGEVHDDPVVFAARDWQSLTLFILLACLAIFASLRGS